MPREEPYFRKCCFCIPLKSCLQTWSVIKSMADISLVFFILFVILILSINPKFHEAIALTFNMSRFSMEHALLILVILLVIDSVFMVVLSVGLFTNNMRNLRIFYYYSFYMVAMGIIFVLAVIINMLCKLEMMNKHDHLLLSMFAVCGFINTGLDIGIILTLKSEMIKIRNKQQYEFVKMPTLKKEVDPPGPFEADEEYIG